MNHPTFPGHPPATLVRQYIGRLLDISGVGCLLETDASLPVGAIGRVEAVIDGQLHIEAVRVARVSPARDFGLNEIGLEFLPVAPPSAHSIRAAVSRLGDGSHAFITFVH